MTLKNCIIKDDDCSSEGEADDEDLDHVEEGSLSEDAQRFFSNEAKNNSMVLSYKDNNACFVFRGGEMGIFSQRDDHQQIMLSHTAKTILKDGRHLRQAIPYLGESSILLVDSENQVSHLDLECEQIVNEWKVAGDDPCKYQGMNGI